MFLPLAFALVAAADPYAPRRAAMVRETIEARGVKNPAVLKSVRTVPRHLFVPAYLRDQAYQDRPLPLAQGQTISQPYIVAVMTELLEPDRSHRVLEIGTGSGYQAAVLSPLVREVFTMEIVPELAESSARRLASLGYSNVTVRLGDGYKGWPDKAPFDRIILTASPKDVPPALLDQLKPGGKLVGPVGAGFFDQELIVIDKGRDGTLKRRAVLPVRFVPMVKGR
jgi:protein-L-isoaspartate(D-aspartate) O-methyltransferase